MAADDPPIKMTDSERPLEIVDVVVGIASNDFSRRARIGDGRHLLDGLAAGINMLAEEVAAQHQREQRFQQRMRRTEKLAAIGQLAAGVAHEINNPAAFVLANLQALDRLLAGVGAPSSTAPAADLDVAATFAQAREITRANLAGLERIVAIVRDLKNFARLESEDLAVVAIDDVVDDACRLVRAELAYRAQLVVHRAPGVHVRGSRSRLVQVLTNLLFNAAHAIPDGQPSANTVTVTSQVRHDQVVVSVRDTGSGLTPEAEVHLFEPFFTTKPRDQGTGLGLPISADIARQHGGELLLESTSAEGTTFVLTLPQDLTPVVAPVVPAPSTGLSTRPRILLIDDEPLLLDSWKRLFAAEYALSTVNGGREAIERLTTDARWDVLVCDLMMPDVDGAAVYEWVRAHRPELAGRMLFCSGGAFTPRGFAFVDLIGDRLLAKPVRPAELRAAVSRLVREQA